MIRRICCLIFASVTLRRDANAVLASGFALHDPLFALILQPITSLSAGQGTPSLVSNSPFQSLELVTHCVKKLSYDPRQSSHIQSLIGSKRILVALKLSPVSSMYH